MFYIIPKHWLIIGLLIFGGPFFSKAQVTKNYTSETLVVQQISKHVYQHISFLQTDSFGKVPCNGMIVFDKKEAIVFDTPTDGKASLELIHWIQNSLQCKVTAIVPTHFHEDCVAGLAAFHQHGIPSYAHTATIELARSKNKPVPQNGFAQQQEFKVGRKKVVTAYLGAGHTQDNVLGYFPGDHVLFG